MTTHRNCSTPPTDFLEYMASFNDLKETVNIDSDSSDDIKIVCESELPNHRCDLCCEGEFLIDKLLRFGGLINKKYKFVCDKCDKNFVQKSECKKHERQCTGPDLNSSEVSLSEAKKTYNCETCPRTFKSQGGLTKHIKSQHSGLTHTCEICKKVFTNFQKFSQHHFKHCFNRSPYVCKFCEERLNTETALNNHYIKIHNIGKFVFQNSSF